MLSFGDDGNKMLMDVVENCLYQNAGIPFSCSADSFAYRMG